MVPKPNGEFTTHILSFNGKYVVMYSMYDVLILCGIDSLEPIRARYQY